MHVKKHWKKILVIAILFVVFLGRYEYKMPKRSFADFHAYYYTGQKMLKNENVYDRASFEKDGIANFKYPPLFATISALFALTSERAAATSWFIFNFILVILFIYYSGGLIFGEYLTPRQRNWIYFWSLIMTSRFYMQNFDEGQVNILMMSTLLFGIYSAHRKSDFWAGLFIGFSTLVKYMTAVFIPYFLFRRRFKLVFYTLLSLVIFSLLPALFWGWERNLFLQKNFFPYVCKTSLDMHSLSDYANQSILATVVRFFSDHGGYGINLMQLSDNSLKLSAAVICLLMFVLSIYPVNTSQLFKAGNNLGKIDISLFLICAALFNPNAWMHNFIFLTFAYMVSLLYLYRVKVVDKTVIFLIALSFILHSLTNSFLARSWSGNWFEIFSFVNFGAIILFIALLKIKFFPKEIRV